MLFIKIFQRKTTNGGNINTQKNNKIQFVSNWEVGLIALEVVAEVSRINFLFFIWIMATELVEGLCDFF